MFSLLDLIAACLSDTLHTIVLYCSLHFLLHIFFHLLVQINSFFVSRLLRRQRARSTMHLFGSPKGMCSP
jgi:hypothetical protein